MNYWHLAAAIIVWLMAVALGVLGVRLWNAGGLTLSVSWRWRAYGPILCVFMLIIAGLYVGAGFALL